MCPLPTMTLTPPRQGVSVGFLRGEQLRHPSDYLPVSGPIWEVQLQWNSSTRKRESVAKVLTHPYLHTQDDGGMLAFCTLDPLAWVLPPSSPASEASPLVLQHLPTTKNI